MDFDAWRNRFQKHRHRTQAYPTVDQAIELSRGWGTVDRTVGILYRWQHKGTGKLYIGITTESLEERVRGHLRTVERGDFSSNGLHADIEKFGVPAFKIHEIERFADLSTLVEAECESIIFHNSIFPHGYNLVEGGRGVSLRMLPTSFRGRKYKNLAALADDYAQPVKRVESRLRWGWSMEEAVDLPKGSQRK